MSELQGADAYSSNVPTEYVERIVWYCTTHENARVGKPAGVFRYRLQYNRDRMDTRMSTTQQHQKTDAAADEAIEAYLAVTREIGGNDADALIALALRAFRRVTE